MPEGVSGPQILNPWGYTRGGPVMGPVGPDVVRRARVRSVTLAPQAVPAIGLKDESEFGTGSGIEMYQTCAEIWIPYYPGSGGVITVPFFDREIPKPIVPDEFLDVVIQVKIHQP